MKLAYDLSLTSLRHAGGGGAGSLLFEDTFTVETNTEPTSHQADTGGADPSWSLLFQTGARNGIILSVSDALAPDNTELNDGFGYSVLLASPLPSADYSMEVDGDTNGALGGTRWFGLYARAVDADNMMAVGWSANPATNPNLKLAVISSGTPTVIASDQIAALAFNGTPVTIKLKCVGSLYTVEVDGTPVLEETDATLSAAGAAGVWVGNKLVATDDIDAGVRFLRAAIRDLS